MNGKTLDIVILGLTITSSWGNGHATTFRALTRALAGRGHRLLFLERDTPWYANQRDLPDPPYCPTRLYGDLAELDANYASRVAAADLVIVGSCVPEGTAVGDWACTTATGVTAFYDIDTPVTLSALEQGRCDYLTPELIRRYDLYLSFAGGPVLQRLEKELAAPMARPLYCCVDPDRYRPDPAIGQRYDLGYMGTYSPDRQPKLERLLLEPARDWTQGRFVVAGPQYPDQVEWPANVERHDHIAPDAHSAFYNAQRFTLNLTRADMVAVGYSPSVRLFEAAACATPVISDHWEGLDDFFAIGDEILVASDPDEVLRALTDISDARRRQLGVAARKRVLAAHTAEHRAMEFEGHYRDCRQRARRRSA